MKYHLLRAINQKFIRMLKKEEVEEKKKERGGEEEGCFATDEGGRRSENPRNVRTAGKYPPRNDTKGRFLWKDFSFP